MKPKMLTVALMTAVGLSVGLKYPTLAQTTPSGTESQPATQSTQTNNLNSEDKQFMMQAAQGGLAEVQMAQLALQKGTTDPVKDYAQQMLEQHNQANAQLQQLAAAKGVTLPTSLDARNQKLYNRLSQLSGTNFDRDYIRQAGIKAHTQQDQLYRKEIQRGQDADVKDFARRVLPIVNQHLTLAHDIVAGRAATTNNQMNNNTNNQMNNQ